MTNKRIVWVIVVASFFLLAASLFPLFHNVTSAQAQTAGFTFTAAGDYGGGSNFTGVMNAIKNTNPDFHLALGDLSYQTTSSGATSWSNNVKNILGSTFPFEIIVGNHDNQNIDSYISALPNRLDVTITGTYGKEYYYDYPKSAPLARMIHIAPGDNVFGWRYLNGDSHYTWLASAIDDARAKNIPWVIVAMHEDCLSTGDKVCAFSSGIGQDVFNLLIAKKVDLILQGHDHVYERSKQLALSSGCSGVIDGTFNSNCVVASGPNYTKGLGSVVVVNGTGGTSLYDAKASDSDAGFFATINGSANATYGVVKYAVSPTQIQATYVKGAGGTFTDSFTIAGSGSGGQTPTNTPTPTQPPNVPTNTPTPKPSNTPTPTPTIVSCPVLPSDFGSATATVTMSAPGTYRVWSRVEAPDSTNNSYYFKVDNQCALLIGDSSQLQPNTWTWVNYQDGNIGNTASVNLAAGAHTLTFVGREAGVRLDRVILTSDTACQPTGVGDNCANVVTATPTLAPTNTPVPPTNTPVPSNTPVPPTNTPTPVPTGVTPLPTHTPTPTLRPTNSPTPRPSDTPTPKPTNTPVPPTNTPTPTAAPAGTPSGSEVALNDNFEDGNATGWKPAGGTWNVCQPLFRSKEYCNSDTKTNLSTAGSNSWSDYIVQAGTVMTDDDGSIGVLGRVQDSTHYYNLELKKDPTGVKKWWLWRNDGSTFTTIASGPYNFGANNYYNLRLSFVDSTLTAAISTDHGTTFTTLGTVSDSHYLTGRIGVKAGVTPARFDDVQVVDLGSTTKTFTAVADTYVSSDSPSKNFGTSGVLYIDAKPVRITYLKFDLSSLNGASIKSAKLRIKTTSAKYSGSPNTQTVKLGTSSSWNETSTLYTSKPALSATVIGSVSSSKSNTTYTIPLTPSALQGGVGGILTLSIDTTGEDAFYIDSRESSTKPQLILEL